ncbi:MAG: hypothetical protein M0P31_06020 [Solirubrobacteraceae bacterium]|nr:hypothetical protein [Solirubrobacteraceae bacterium]
MITDRRTEWAVLALGLALAVAAWAAWPGAGNYDSVLNLVWAREVLDGGAPGFEAYAASTPHPLWLAIGLPTVALFGDDGDRVLVLLSALALPVLAAAAVRLGRLAGEAVATPDRAARTGAAVGLLAGLLVLSSVALLLLAARGYLDVPFLALVAWAAVWIARGPSSATARWGAAGLLLLAGLLRPEAWLLAGLHWLWCCRSDASSPTHDGAERAPGRGRGAVARTTAGVLRGARTRAGLLHLGIVAAAPGLWMLVDLVVTGDPLHSLTATSALADALGRERGIVAAPRLLVTQTVDQARAPIVPAGVAGLAVLLLGHRIGLRRPPGRVAAVLAALTVAGGATFLAAGVAGLSLIPRYLTVPVVALTILAALAAGGWIGLPDGHRWRRPWAIVVLLGAVVGVGGYVALKGDTFSRVRTELRFLADARTDVRDLVDDPAVRRAARCGPVSLPTYRLVPEIRLRLDVDGDRVLARSDPRAARLGVTRSGVAIVVDEGKPARRYGRADGVPRSTQPAPAGFRPIARRGPFVAWARCP